MKKRENKPPELVKEFCKPAIAGEPPKFERVRVKCPECGWVRILRLRPNQREVECVCNHRLNREQLKDHTLPLPKHLDAADKHMDYEEPDDG